MSRRITTQPTCGPNQLARLKAQPGLLGTAVEEIIGWTAPVEEFMRTATGVPIRVGESVLLSYVSANRDEDVLDEPARFDVGRDPNTHLSLGYSLH